MNASGAITYGNYFALSKKVKYTIEVDIYQSDKSGHEEVKFSFKKH